MMNNKKIKLLRVWAVSLFAELSISEIMRIANKNTKPWVFNTLKLLVKNKILTSKRKGNLDIYGLNIKNPLAMQMVQYSEIQENINFQQLELIWEIIEKVLAKSYSLLVFGSYANNKQRKNSDIDICFLIENKDLEKKIKPYVNDIKLNHIIKIDDHYITFEDFVKMLLNNEENISKQIFRKRKIFYNGDIYYQLIKRAYDNGFRQP